MKEIRVGYLSTAYHTSLIIMGARLIEKKMNLKPFWRLFGGGPSIVNAFAANELDIGYIGLPPVMVGIDNGVPIKCVTGGHMEGTVFFARNCFKSLNEHKGDIKSTLCQFNGGVIGSPPKGSIHDVIIRALLKRYRLKDIKVKNFEWADFILEAIEDREIEAAVGTPALMVAADTAKMIIPPSKLWPNNPSYGIIASHDLIENSPELIKGFLRLHNDATNLITVKPTEAADIVSRGMNVVSKSFILRVYEISPKYCAGLPEKFVNATLKFVPVLRGLKYILRDLTKADIFDEQFVKNIL